MIPPSCRVWVYVPDGDPDAAEILVIGALADIGQPFAAVKSAAERWPGFHNVEIVGGGTICGMLRVHLTTVCRYRDPVGEFLAMLGDLTGPLLAWGRRIEWITTDNPRTGCVGTW